MMDFFEGGSMDKKIEELYKNIEKSNNQLLEIWLDNVLFTWQWWLEVFLCIFPWTLWFIFRKKESTFRLLCAGFSIVILSSWMDFLGVTFGLWYYKYDVIPTIPPYALGT
jgi:magnesium-transporting ATPase (P-type)